MDELEVMQTIQAALNKFSDPNLKGIRFVESGDKSEIIIDIWDENDQVVSWYLSSRSLVRV